MVGATVGAWFASSRSGRLTFGAEIVPVEVPKPALTAKPTNTEARVIPAMTTAAGRGSPPLQGGQHFLGEQRAGALGMRGIGVA